MTPVLALLSPVLAQQQPPPNAPEFGGSSPIGLVVIVLLFIATGLLIRSMNTHLRKVPPTFDRPDGGEQNNAADDVATTAETRTDGDPRDGKG
jgi:hypothetical protein